MYSVRMIKVGKVEFDWAVEKALGNKRKPGVSFEEAVSIFFNKPLQVFFDPDDSEGEDRYVAIGVSIKNRSLVVVHCESHDGVIVRIISARKATKHEQNRLYGGE